MSVGTTNGSKQHPRHARVGEQPFDARPGAGDSFVESPTSSADPEEAIFRPLSKQPAVSPDESGKLTSSAAVAVPRWVPLAVCVLAIALVVAFAVQSCRGKATAASETFQTADLGAEVSDAAVAQSAALQAKSDSPDPASVATVAQSALDASEGAEGIALFGESGESRTISPDELPEVAAATEAFSEQGYGVGFVVYDIQSGTGIEYNADEEFFSASTIKAPFAVALASAVDAGEATISNTGEIAGWGSTSDGSHESADAGYFGQDIVSGLGEAWGTAFADEAESNQNHDSDQGESQQLTFDTQLNEDVIVDGTGVMAADDKSQYALSEVIENTLTHSDNTGYALLREHCNDGGMFENWCAMQGVDATAWEGMWYPYCTTRDLAKLWLGAGSYLLSGAEHASWVDGLLRSTDLSFFRNSITGAQKILSKPGYECEPMLDMSALAEGGTIVGDDGTYVLAIMSDAPYDDEYLTENQQLIENLASALANARATLLIRGF